MADIRPPLGPILDAFGVPATVTRPAPDDSPIETTGVWVSEEALEVPNGLAVRRREQIRVMAFSRTAVPTIPTRSLIVAPELIGGPDRTWMVDGYAGGDSDMHRVFLVLSESES